MPWDCSWSVGLHGGVCRASHWLGSRVSCSPCGILLGARKTLSNVGFSVPRSRAVGRKAWLGIASHSLPKHCVTFPIPAR